MILSYPNPNPIIVIDIISSSSTSHDEILLFTTGSLWSLSLHFFIFQEGERERELYLSPLFKTEKYIYRKQAMLLTMAFYSIGKTLHVRDLRRFKSYYCNKALFRLDLDYARAFAQIPPPPPLWVKLPALPTRPQAPGSAASCGSRTQPVQLATTP